MKLNSPKIAIAAIVMICAWGCSQAQGQGPGYGDLPPDGIEFLTRGPVHEAFAEPIALSEDSVMTVTVQPPEPIAEAAPGEMPDIANVVWIPGYWCWDADINNFMWVSGCWRVPPPQSSWVPGYWARVQAGWQWTPGFWMSADATEIQYLPPPPPSLDEGPPGGPPTAGEVWAPGCWMWKHDRHVWRPGFWQAAHADWQWIPAHYVWTPRGCIFVEGYWDYKLSYRGVLFTPIFCPTRAYARAGFAYTPSVVIDIELLVKNLFCCPRYDHYYFGDYYDARYAKAGIFPWFDAAKHHEYFDPIFAHRQWKNRDKHEWLTGVQDEYVRRQKEPDARPARTYSALQAQIGKLPEAKRNEFHVARPLSSYVDNKESTLKFQKVTPDREAQIIRQSGAIHDFKNDRRTWEAPTLTTTGDHGKPPIVGPEVKLPPPTPHIIAPPPHVDAADTHEATAHGTFIRPQAPRLQTEEHVDFTPHATKFNTPPVVGPRSNAMGKDYAPPPVPASPQPNPDIKPRFNPRDDHDGHDDHRGRG